MATGKKRMTPAENARLEKALSEVLEGERTIPELAKLHRVQARILRLRLDRHYREQPHDPRRHKAARTPRSPEMATRLGVEPQRPRRRKTGPPPDATPDAPYGYTKRGEPRKGPGGRRSRGAEPAPRDDRQQSLLLSNGHDHDHDGGTLLDDIVRSETGSGLADDAARAVRIGDDRKIEYLSGTLREALRERDAVLLTLRLMMRNETERGIL
jgi:hypothetical protein